MLTLRRDPWKDEGLLAEPPRRLPQEHDDTRHATTGHHRSLFHGPVVRIRGSGTQV